MARGHTQQYAAAAKEPCCEAWSHHQGKPCSESWRHSASSVHGKDEWMILEWEILEFAQKELTFYTSKFVQLDVAAPDLNRVCSVLWEEVTWTMPII
jgi:hypothetical protein